MIYIHYYFCDCFVTVHDCDLVYYYVYNYVCSAFLVLLLNCNQFNYYNYYNTLIFCQSACTCMNMHATGM